MKLTSLVECGEKAASYILDLDGISILLDCDIDPSSLLSFAPPKTDIVRLPAARTCFASVGNLSTPTLSQTPSPSIQSNDGSHRSHFPVRPAPQKRSRKGGKKDGLESKSVSSKLGDVHTIGSHAFLESYVPLIRTPWLNSSQLSRVDVVLLSHASAILGLPYMMPFLKSDVKIYACEPALQTAKHLMHALVHQVEELGASAMPSTPLHNPRVDRLEMGERISLTCKPHTLRSMLAELPPALRGQFGRHPSLLKPVYGGTAARVALERVRTVSFGEIVRLREGSSLRGCAHSSGHALGSAMWRIFDLSRPSRARFLYLSRASAQSALHPKPFDSDEKLRHADAMLMTGLALPAPMMTPEKSVRSLCGSIASTISHGGNVLMPVAPGGSAFDLLEVIRNHLHQIKLRCPIYWVGPTAHHALAYANIAPEWVCEERLQKIYDPRPPFPFAEYISSGMLAHFRSVGGQFSESVSDWFCMQFQSPCIVFTGHTSLRFGDVLYFLDAWKEDVRNVIIFTDPTVETTAALAPHQPMVMRVETFPVDARLQGREADALIKTLSPRALVVPAVYQTMSSEWISPTCPVYGLEALSSRTLSTKLEEKGEVVVAQGEGQVGYGDGYVTAHITPALAGACKVHRLGDQLGVGVIQAMLSPKNDELEMSELQAANAADVRLSTFAGPKLLGRIDVDALVKVLQERGISPIDLKKMEKSSGGYELHLPSLRAIVFLEEKGKTRVQFEESFEYRDEFDDARNILLNSILSQLDEFISPA